MHKIMIVDDTKTERDCIRFLIDRFKLSLEASEACNGNEALQLLSDERFDILFTDVKMPFMDGLALSKAALYHNPKLKIIIFSAYDEFEYAKAAVGLGVSEYLLKPIVPEEFHNCIKKVLSEIPPPPAVQSDRVETVKQYICQNYDKDLSLDLLANMVFVHPDHLNRVFKQETGTTLNRFIRAYRMEKAKELLESSHIKIREVSLAVGYKNYSYFCQSFREHFGTSPKKIRKTDGKT